MLLKLSCPACLQRLMVTVDHPGQKVRCGQCQIVFEARPPADVFPAGSPDALSSLPANALDPAPVVTINP
jgi:hypothetical protein